MRGGVYQPRSGWRDVRESLDRLGRSLGRWLRVAVVRFAGAVQLLCAGLVLLALVSYRAADPSMDNATGGAAANLLGLIGATAADIFLQYFGFAAYAFLLPLFAWGWRALRGRTLKHASWRLVAWLAGTVLLAVGLGALPALTSMPAGCGGVIGIFAGFQVDILGRATAQPWLRFALLPVFGLLGVFLSGWAADLHPSRWRMPWRREAPNWIEEAEAEERAEPTIEDEEPFITNEDEVLPEPVLTAPAADGEPRPLVTSIKPVTPPKRARQPLLNLQDGSYQFPPLDLLTEPPAERSRDAQSEDLLAENARALEMVLADFGVKGRIREVRAGPVVTLYEFEPAAGVKSSRVIALSDDIARSMSAVAARVAVIPGRNVLGIELPNRTRETVYLRELLATEAFENARSALNLALGKTIGGEPVVTDLAKMPHLLIAGTTGSGKSVAVNTMILSLLFRLTPQQCRLIMVDPKMLELSVYDGIPHLLTPVVTDPKKAVVALKWAVREMEERYRKMSKLGVRGVEAFNDRVLKAKNKGETLKRRVQTGFDRETGKPIYEDEVLDLEPMPYIVVVVDEMADLMMISGKEIEGAIQRLAQMARAAGLHLITATQRPSVDVITGTIKANFPTRISFQVTSKIDSRTILGEQGAEQLLGMGDMLYMMAGGRIKRVHGPFVSDREVEDVVNFLKNQGHPEYLDAVTEETDDEDGGAAGSFGQGNGSSGDDLYDKALDIVARERKASTSYIQRRLQIGYNRAARLIERMEEENVVSRPNHKGVREVLLPDHREE